MGAKERDRVGGSSTENVRYMKDVNLIHKKGKCPHHEALALFESDEQRHLYGLASDLARLIRITEEAIRIGQELAEDRTLKSTARKRLAELRLLTEMTGL